MRIRDLSPAQRADIGRALYQDRQAGIVASYAKGARTKERDIRRIWHALDAALDRYQTRRDWLAPIAA